MLALKVDNITTKNGNFYFDDPLPCFADSNNWLKVHASCKFCA